MQILYRWVWLRGWNIEGIFKNQIESKRVNFIFAGVLLTFEFPEWHISIIPYTYEAYAIFRKKKNYFLFNVFLGCGQEKKLFFFNVFLGCGGLNSLFNSIPIFRHHFYMSLFYNQKIKSWMGINLNNVSLIWEPRDLSSYQELSKRRAELCQPFI